MHLADLEAKSTRLTRRLNARGSRGKDCWGDFSPPCPACLLTGRGTDPERRADWPRAGGGGEGG